MLFPLPTDLSRMDPLDVLLYATATGYGLLCIFGGYLCIHLVVLGLPAVAMVAVADTTDWNRNSGVAGVLIVFFLCLLLRKRLSREPWFVKVSSFILFMITAALSVDVIMDSAAALSAGVQLLTYLVGFSFFVLYCQYLARTTRRLRLVHTTAVFGALTLSEMFEKGRDETLVLQAAARLVVTALLAAFGIWVQTRESMSSDSRLSYVITEASNISTPRPDANEWVSMPFAEVTIQDDADLEALKEVICRLERGTA
ncbi:hypothetical protein ACHHYP_03119 [Achlya hypogyna]|uniref:Transmembrane protein n=1 Tax=Achlya hypogyna TaxID=1202772 RepID=A0A1V9Z4E0_ACHHY|nr:hypothetical protein ACHHYP_03119 [Achlya hypogyna]